MSDFCCYQSLLILLLWYLLFLGCRKGFKDLITPLITLEIQVGERRVSEYQEGGMPFGLGDGLALNLGPTQFSPSF